MPGLGAAGQGGGGGPGPSKGGGGSRIFSGGAHTKLKPLENRANLTERPNKLRFELGSTQAEAVRLQFYKKFKFS